MLWWCSPHLRPTRTNPERSRTAQIAGGGVAPLRKLELPTQLLANSGGALYVDPFENVFLQVVWCV